MQKAGCGRKIEFSTALTILSLTIGIASGYSLYAYLFAPRGLKRQSRLPEPSYSRVVIGLILYMLCVYLLYLRLLK